jgi:hypothetical protein
MSDSLVIRKVIQDIPVYEFYKNNRQAVDQYLEIAYPYMKDHIDQGKVYQPFCYILDVSRSGMYPINYMVQRATVLMSGFDVPPPNYIAFIAKNPNDAVLVNMIDGLTARNMEHTRKIFPIEKFDDAIAWLQGVIRDAG